MISPVSKRVAAKFWNGERSPRFLCALDHQLCSAGFSFDSHDDAPCSTWAKDFLDDCAIQLSIWPRSSSPGAFSFHTSISIVCCPKNFASAWESVSGRPGSVTVLSCSLDWFAICFGLASSFKNLFDDANDVAAVDAPTTAIRVAELGSTVASRLSNLFPTRSDLAAALLALPAFSGSLGGKNGPVSSDPVLFAALLIAADGDLVRARKTLSDEALRNPNGSARQDVDRVLSALEI
jgi:hypothetical protein